LASKDCTGLLTALNHAGILGHLANRGSIQPLQGPLGLPRRQGSLGSTNPAPKGGHLPIPATSILPEFLK
jgi:hypothetical protein